MLTVEGYYNDSQVSGLYYFREHNKYVERAEHYLIIGPYGHFGAQRGGEKDLQGIVVDPAALIDLKGITYQWFDYTLRNGDRPEFLRDKVNYQVMGTNRWEHSPSLADMSNETLTLYLSNQQNDDNSTYKLDASPPTVPGSLSQSVDFKDRATTNNDYYPDPIVRKRIDTTNGFIFVSEPFTDDMIVNGSFSGNLALSINKRDVDFGVTLYELMPTGEYFHLSYYIGRASFAKDRTKRSLLKPNEIEHVPFSNARLVSKKLHRGSRLVAYVNVNKNPFSQLNYGTGKDVSDETIADAGTALQIHWHNESFIRIPIRTTTPLAASTSTSTQPQPQPATPRRLRQEQFTNRASLVNQPQVQSDDPGGAPPAVSIDGPVGVPVDVPTWGAWAFLVLAFTMIGAILAAFLLWQDALAKVFGPLSASHPLFILAVWSPALSSWAVILYTTGWAGFRGYLSRFSVWRCGIPWAVVIVLVIPFIYYLGAWLKGEPSYTLWPFDTVGSGLAALGLMAILGPIEEFGWRDLLQPLLQRLYTPLVASIFVGCAWGIWHLPAFFLSGLPQSNWEVLPFLIGVVAVSIIITPLFNSTRGGIVLPMLFHFQLNNPMWPDALPFDIPLFVALAAVITFIYRKEMFERKWGVTRVTGLQGQGQGHAPGE